MSCAAVVVLGSLFGLGSGFQGAAVAAEQGRAGKEGAVAAGSRRGGGRKAQRTQGAGQCVHAKGAGAGEASSECKCECAAACWCVIVVRVAAGWSRWPGDWRSSRVYTYAS